jgi:peptidoglycan/xylan/chitin deacetylase (PgdA/CDA1 family)
MARAAADVDRFRRLSLVGSSLLFASALATNCTVETTSKARSVSSGGAAGSSVGVVTVVAPRDGGSSADGPVSSGSGGAGASDATSEAAALPAVEVAPWKGGARGAYTIIHDDLCSIGSDFNAAQRLATQSFRAGFGAIVGACTDAQWAQIQSDLVAKGHEVLNHGLSHICLAYNPEDTGNCGQPQGATTWQDLYPKEIDQANDILQMKLPGQGTFFIFPYDSYDEPALAHLLSLGFLGARAGTKGGAPNASDSLDDFHLTYDVYGPGFSRYRQGGPCAAAGVAALQLWNQPYDAGGQHYTEIPIECREYVLSAYVDEILATGGWGIREMHGIDELWEPMTPDEYDTHLAYLATRVASGDLWVDAPTAVVKYRRARASCKVTLDTSTSKLTFGTLSADCQKYKTPLAVYVTLPGAAGLSAAQTGTPLVVKKVGSDRFLVGDVVPGDDVTLTPE